MSIAPDPSILIVQLSSLGSASKALARVMPGSGGTSRVYGRRTAGTTVTATDVTMAAFSAPCAEGMICEYRLAPHLGDVIDHLVGDGPYCRSRRRKSGIDTRSVEETPEQQVKLQRIQIYILRAGDQRTGTGATARPNRRSLLSSDH